MISEILNWRKKKLLRYRNVTQKFLLTQRQHTYRKNTIIAIKKNLRFYSVFFCVNNMKYICLFISISNLQIFTIYFCWFSRGNISFDVDNIIRFKIHTKYRQLDIILFSGNFFILLSLKGILFHFIKKCFYQEFKLIKTFVYKHTYIYNT